MRKPAPLDRLSAEEEKRFPGAKVLDSRETAGPDPGQSTRVRILETDFKYPFLRTEEILEAATGALLYREEMVADHVLVTLAEGQDPAALLAVANLQDVRLERVGPYSPLYRLHLPSVALDGVPEALEVLTRAGGKEIAAEPDFVRHALLVPNDPKFTDQTLWGLQQSSDRDIDAPEAWDLRTSADGVIVAVIDTGIRYTHQDLAANMWTNPGETAGNGRDDDGNGYVDDVYGMDSYNRDGNPMDDHGHGSHCSGTIGARGNNGIGLTGVAWNVKLMGLKFLSASGSGSDSDAISCIDYARAKGAKILSCSWGGGGPGASLSAAIDRARADGIIMAAAAGNESSNNDSYPSYPASYPQDNIVSVAATTSMDGLASFSNYGATSVDLGAPGDGIYSCTADSNSSYDSWSGTSMATPHVAGALALLVAHFPGDTHTMRIQRLVATADSIPALTGKARAGRLNLARALGNTNIPPPPPPPPGPENDNFADATVLTGKSGTVGADSTTATAEEGEPSHVGFPPTKSIWFTWQAPEAGTATFSTAGSRFDTLLAVYRGSSLGGLVSVASNDDAAADYSSRVGFSAQAGVVYQIAVDGYNGAGGSVTLKYSLSSQSSVPNDMFASATSISGSNFRVTGRNTGATRETGEPNHAMNPGGRSVWWRWQAPVTGKLSLKTSGSSFDTLLAVYSGSSVDTLSFLAANDDYAQKSTSQVDLSVLAGQIYQIAVDGYGGDSGTIRLSGSIQRGRQTRSPGGLLAEIRPGQKIMVTCQPLSSAGWYEAEGRVGDAFWGIMTSSKPEFNFSDAFGRKAPLELRVRAVEGDGAPGLWSDNITLPVR